MTDNPETHELEMALHYLRSARKYIFKLDGEGYALSDSLNELIEALEYHDPN